MPECHRGVCGGGAVARSGGGGHCTPSAPSATHPMTPFSIRRSNEELLLSRQWAVSHFITCHNDKSPGTNQDAHFTFTKGRNLVDPRGAFLTKASESS